MTEEDNLPPAAAIIAAAIAMVVRASLAQEPRPWRLVLLDSLATAGLSYAAHEMLIGLPEQLGGPLTARFALGASVVIGVIGWAALTRFAWSRWGGAASPK